MSFFDDVWDVVKTGASAIAGDSDTLYPDNPNRRRRANQLYNEVEEIISNIVIEKQRANDALDGLHAQLRDILPMSNFDFKSWQVTSPENLHEVLDIVGVFNAYTIAGVLSIKDIDKQRQFFDVVDIPFGFKLIEIEGVPVIPIGGIIGGTIGGAEERSKLQSYIHQIVPARSQIYLQYMILREINDGLDRMGDKETLKKLGYDEDKIDELFQRQLDEMKKNYSTITINEANKKLAEIDKAKGAWTNDDH